ncbi:ABC transporter ATP-binding protein [Halocatena halophila]|uniref:ABC transporter ATP-binding protein n=1 Tax=Halocatena halophila TaxID=2814576 RepID=UPI002ED3637C
MKRDRDGPNMETPNSERNTVIDVADLTYRYPKSAGPAVQEISFSVFEGEIFGFLGPSGAGKSTTQKVLTGLLDDYTGHAAVLGGEVSQQTGSYYEQIGISAESPNHYLKLTGQENLELFGALYEREIRDPMAVLELVGLDDDATEKVSDYSKGMKGRLNVARALLHDPDVLFLDEPTNGLDPVNARNIKNIVHDLQTAGKTVFITTHNMTVADQLCDRVAFMIDGELPVIDEPTALKRAHGKRRVRIELRRDDRLESREFELDTLSESTAFEELLAAGDIETIHTEEATLEDVFLAVTGEALQ